MRRGGEDLATAMGERGGTDGETGEREVAAEVRRRLLLGCWNFLVSMVQSVQSETTTPLGRLLLSYG